MFTRALNFTIACLGAVIVGCSSSERRELPTAWHTPVTVPATGTPTSLPLSSPTLPLPPATFAPALPLIAPPTLTPTPTAIPTPTKLPVIPRRGDIIAETTDGKHIVIRHEGGEEEITKPVFQAHSRDASVTVNQTFRLRVSDSHRVINEPLDGSRSPGTVALGDRRKRLVDGLVAVDVHGFYAVVVQSHREILLFEAIDAHHQTVIYVIPENYLDIESIAWGTLGQREHDIMLVLRDKHGKPGIYWLSPGAYHLAAPEVVRQECYYSPRLLTDCLLRYNRRLHRELIPVRDNAFHAMVVW